MKTQKSKIVSKLIVGLNLVLVLTGMVIAVPAAHADFISCIAKGEKVTTCLNESKQGAATSFTQFTGGLEAPSTANYSPGLVKATNARDYVLNVTNFALGFLGLIAVVIIIYGGFMYVTAAGKEEQAGKGKKAITYSMIGIIIIMGSYALVNTILQAPSGVEGETPAGSAPGGTTADENQRRRMLFNLASAEVDTIATDFATAYQNYTEIKLALVDLASIPEEGTSEDVRTMLESKKRVLDNILQKAGTFSKMNEKVQAAVDVVDEYLQLSQKAIAAAATDAIPENKWYETFWKDGSKELQTDINNAINKIGADGLGLKGANEKDFAYAVVKVEQRLKDLSDRLTAVSTLPEIEATFKAVLSALKLIASSSKLDLGALAMIPVALAADSSTVNLIETSVLNKIDVGNSDVLQIITLLSALRDQLKDILFIYSAITADVTSGSAPLIVNFDGLKSLDPDNLNLPAESFKWDFGDGSTEDGKVAVQHIFDKVGAYRVKMTVVAPTVGRPPTSSKVVDGLAYVTVTVKQPVIKINLKAIVGENTTYILKQYDKETGKLITDVSILKVTPPEATTGINFDARDTDNITNKIKKVRWNFGNDSPEIIGDTTALVQTAKFAAAGNYHVFVELTDSLNNVDRKVVNVVVGSPIARVTVDPGTEGDISQQFTFDLGGSTSEGGQIKGFDWTKPDPTVATVIKEDKSKGIFTVKFLNSGLYNMSFTAMDTLEKIDTTPIDINITSKPPIASFKYEIPDLKQPGTVRLDGTESYNPDESELDPEYAWTVSGDAANYKFIEKTSATSDKPVVKFLKPGTYTISLVVTNKKANVSPESKTSDSVSQDVTIDSVLDVAWDPGKDYAPSAILAADKDTKEQQAKVNFKLLSDTAVAYQIDYGDGQKEQGDMKDSRGDTKKEAEIKDHIYKEAGVFVVNVSVFDAEDNENTISRKVFIGSDHTPVAQISVLVNGEQVIPDATEPLIVNRKDNVVFDGSGSKNVDGTGRKLNYSWSVTSKLPNSTPEYSVKQQFTKTFDSAGDYNVNLSVKNANDLGMKGLDDPMTVTVVPMPPTLKGLSAVSTSASLTTPVSVKLDAIGAADPDGRVVKYRWWYFEEGSNDEYGVQMTTNPSAVINIGTKGEEGQPKTYFFGVDVTDDENTTFSSTDLPKALWPSITVTNGPNKAPIARFNVDRTSVVVGDSVNFTSASSDPDGKIDEYIWDWEGDGFQNNTNEGPSVAHPFKNAAKDGIRVRLRVKDNEGSEATSDAVTIYVEGQSKPPVAAFTSAQDGTTKKVKFTNTSSADTEGGANLDKYSWDFDTSTDANGDGKKDNDIDSPDKEPTHEYPDYGIYRAKLIVTDSLLAKGEITNYVNVKAPAAAPAAPLTPVTPTPPAAILDARLMTTPAPSFVDGKIHLKGEKADVTFDFSTSVGNIKKYVIDKNILFDSNGNGIKDDDEDYTATAPGKWTTSYSKAYGQVRARLTVIDDKGKKDTVDKDIIFDSSAGSTFMADIFAASEFGMATMFICASAFVILYLKKLLMLIIKQK